MNVNEKIRHENIKAVFKAVAVDGCHTRNAISESVGISAVTVGKIVEDLLDAGILLEKKSMSKRVGRHAGRIILDESKNIVSVDLSERNFSFSVYNMAMKQIYYSTEEYLEDLTCAEAICRFLYRIKSFVKHEIDQGIRPMALGIVVPGNYDMKSDTVSGILPRSFEGIRVRDFVHSMVRMTPDCVMDSRSAALKYCAEGLCSKGNALYIHIGDGVDARLIVDGNVIKRNGCIVDRIPNNDLRATAELIILTMMNAVGLDRVVITADIPSDATAVREMLTSRLSESRSCNKMPDIEAVLPHDCACIGMASMLRWQVIERRIKKLL